MAREAILEPDLPIVDPHHHLWDRSRRWRSCPGPSTNSRKWSARSPRYLLDEFLVDLQSGHNIVATVFVECGAMYRAGGPDALKCVGETEFVNGVAAMSASGSMARCVPAPASSATQISGWATRWKTCWGPYPCRRRTASAVSATAPRRTTTQCAGPAVAAPAPGSISMRRSARASRCPAPLGLSFDAWLLEPQLPDLDRSRTRLSRHPDRARSCRHAARHRRAIAGKREERFGVWKEGIRAWRNARMSSVKLGGLAMPFCDFASYERRNRRDVGTARRRRGSPISRPASRLSAPTAACSKAIFPSTSAAAAIRCCGTRSSGSPPGNSAAEKTALFGGTAARVYRLAL